MTPEPVVLQHLQAAPADSSVGPFGELVAARERFTQPMPDGRVLTVTVRGHAAVHDAAGDEVATTKFGGHIAHVLTTPSGHIWVGYYDQGVFGVDGPGAHGLVRFAPDLTPDWLCPEGLVYDCYTLNVVGEAAWVCPYERFPVLRARDGVVREWANPVAGPYGLLVRGSRVALVGGYHKPDDLMTVGELRDAVHVTGERVLTLPDERALPDDARIVCRGQELHVFTEGQWYGLDLDDVP